MSSRKKASLFFYYLQKFAGFLEAPPPLLVNQVGSDQSSTSYNPLDRVECTFSVKAQQPPRPDRKDTLRANCGSPRNIIWCNLLFIYFHFCHLFRQLTMASVLGKFSSRKRIWRSFSITTESFCICGLLRPFCKGFLIGGSFAAGSSESDSEVRFTTILWNFFGLAVRRLQNVSK